VHDEQGWHGVVTRVEALHKRHRRGPIVLAGVDLVLEPGVPVVLSGANGSGKSTLLRIVAGAATPTAGQVRGRPRVVGYLPDRFPALLRLPVDAYLRHLAAIRGVPADDALLDVLGFTGARADPMARLSKGNAQKVGLTQALACGAGLLVLDEPWAGLDAAAATTLDALLADRASAAAVLITDHTGRAVRLPGARHLALVQGRIEERTTAPVAAPGPATMRTMPGVASGSATTSPTAAVLVVLRSPDPTGLRARLGVPAIVYGDRLLVRVAADASDALLLAALQYGGSVECVGSG
jgi:ABC-2 type transport system ATP-binding protein